MDHLAGEPHTVSNPNGGEGKDRYARKQTFDDGFTKDPTLKSEFLQDINR